ncbi:MAG TPA: ABC transporter permease [Solirubrobacteraceae bacterium]|jgi:ABC-2 type transport system permease protein|nr:ABC transporter permease [Solirubrobacteraceae bacterium]
MITLLAKDLRILARSRLLVAVLVVYPVAIALLIGFAISRSPAKPRLAIVDETPPGATVELGGSRIGIAEYTGELFRQAAVVRVPTRAAAVRRVSSGDVLAAVVIPPDIVSKISSGVSQGRVEVIYNGDALQQSIVRTTIDSALAEANLALSRQIKDVAVRDIDVLLRGGSLGALGSSQSIVGLSHIAPTLDGVAARTPAGADRATLTRIAGFAAFAARNLDIAKNVLTTVSQPIAATSTLLLGRRTPLSDYAVVVAVSISLMLLCVLLAAGGFALEREEHTLARLIRRAPGADRPARPLVTRELLLAEKALLAAACAFLVALAMLLGVSAFVALESSRVGVWVLALAFAALAFAALGVAIGALAREVRAASLLAFLLVLPLAFLALVPHGSVAGGLYAIIQAVSFVFPFKAALQALDAAVNRSSPGVAISVAHLLGLTLLFGALARLGCRRAE